MYCRNCGKQIGGSAKFCKYCGVPTYPNANNSSQRGPKKAGRGGRKLIVLIAIIFALCGLSILGIKLGLVQSLFINHKVGVELVLHLRQSEWQQSDDTANLEFWISDMAPRINNLALYDSSGLLLTEMDDTGSGSNGDWVANDGIFSAVVEIQLTQSGSTAYHAEYQIDGETYLTNEVVATVTEFPEEYYQSETVTDSELEVLMMSDDYLALSDTEKVDYILQELNAISKNDKKTGNSFVYKDSVFYDEETNTVFFIEAAGTYCYIDFRDYEDGTSESDMQEDSEVNDLTFFSECTSANNVEGEILILSALSDNENTSISRYSVLSNAINRETTLHCDVIVGSLDNFRTALLNKKLIVIECHGNLFKLDGEKVPMISAFGLAKDTVEKDELKSDKESHRVCKKLVDHGDGTHFYYLITPSFFEFYYNRESRLADSIIHIGSCHGLGNDHNHPNYHLSSALLNAGASVIVGHTNSVYTDYDWWILYGELHSLLNGNNIKVALSASEDEYGASDVDFINQFGDEKSRKDAQTHTAARNVIHGNNYYSLFGNLAEFGVFSGIVVDAESGKPIQYAKVSIQSSDSSDNGVTSTIPVETDVNGEFHISGFGECVITIQKEGYVPINVARYIVDDEDISLGTIEMSTQETANHSRLPVVENDIQRKFWIEAYEQIIRQHIGDGTNCAHLLDVDHNGIPELLIGGMTGANGYGGFEAAYTYREGQAVQLQLSDVAVVVGDDYYGDYPTPINMNGAEFHQFVAEQNGLRRLECEIRLPEGARGVLIYLGEIEIQGSELRFTSYGSKLIPLTNGPVVTDEQQEFEVEIEEWNTGWLENTNYEHYQDYFSISSTTEDIREFLEQFGGVSPESEKSFFDLVAGKSLCKHGPVGTEQITISSDGSVKLLEMSQGTRAISCAKGAGVFVDKGSIAAGVRWLELSELVGSVWSSYYEVAEDGSPGEEVREQVDLSEVIGNQYYLLLPGSHAPDEIDAYINTDDIDSEGYVTKVMLWDLDKGWLYVEDASYMDESDVDAFARNHGFDLENSTYTTNIRIPEGAVILGGHYYYYYGKENAATWNEAESFCESLGGHLATLNSAEENEFVHNYLIDHDIQDAYFGFTDEESEGEWVWVTGESVEYSNWHDGEPNNERSVEDYATFYNKFADETWNDGDYGYDEFGFICEWDNGPVSEVIADTFEYLYIDGDYLSENGNEIDIAIYTSVFEYSYGEEWGVIYGSCVDGVIYDPFPEAEIQSIASHHAGLVVRDTNIYEICDRDYENETITPTGYLITADNNGNTVRLYKGNQLIETFYLIDEHRYH